MKQIKQLLISEATKWDKTHRIVGPEGVSSLLAESEEAFRSFKRPDAPAVLVDVGAGAGVLGFPWLYLGMGAATVFIEPATKKAAFLRYFKTLLPKEQQNRVLIIDKPLESVSRETILDFSGDRPLLFAARAFSGPHDLKACVLASAFKEETFFVFSSQASRPGSKSFVFEKLQ